MFDDFIFSVVVILLIIILFFIIINFIKFLINYINRKKFLNEYGIFLSNDFKVSKRKKKYSVNSFVLDYPRWLYSNKDGSKNRVRSNNYLVDGNSYLNYENYHISALHPFLVLDLVDKLRDIYGDFSVEMCVEEINKYNLLKNKKDMISCAHQIESILGKFSSDPTDFEKFCAELFSKMGYKTEVTPKTGDGGFDIVLHKGKTKGIVECKCYNRNYSIGRPMIQKLVGANQKEHATQMFFVTTSCFSKDAVAFADETNVHLIDGDKLIELIDEYFDNKNEINISRSEWRLEHEDLKKYFPPDV